ncbi:EamA family transporter RarD [Inquilinus limosus]|uniref:EamA family transporter RarD n=1 Tax=Inquilinus limosus TaxID=171674 RepID=UPI003F1736B8
MAVDASSSRSRAGLGAGAALGAFLIWGFAPLYFKAVEHIGAWQIVAHRILWSVVILGLLLLALGRLHEIRDVVRSRRRFLTYLATTALVTTNWSVFIWAVLNGYLVQSALGYYLSPLVNVLLGVAFLGERLGRMQVVAVGLAAAGVLVSVIGAGEVPWIALILASTWGFYGLIRKREKIDPFVGLMVETGFLLPVCLAYLLWLWGQGAGAFGPVMAGGEGWAMSLALMASGVITGMPIVLYMIGARHLPLSTVGLLQYLAPSINLVLATLVFEEPLRPATLVTFAFIWAGLALFTIDATRRARLPVAPRHGVG